MNKDQISRIKCPSCGVLMGRGQPYKTFSPIHTEGYPEISSNEAEPEWLAQLPVSGHRYRCACGCSVDLPAAR